MDLIQMEEWQSHSYAEIGAILANLLEYQSPLEIAASLDRVSKDLKNYFTAAIEDAIERGQRDDERSVVRIDGPPPCPPLPMKYDPIPADDHDPIFLYDPETGPVRDLISAIGAHAVAIGIAAEMLHASDDSKTAHEWKTEILAAARKRYVKMFSAELRLELMETLAILEALPDR